MLSQISESVMEFNKNPHMWFMHLTQCFERVRLINMLNQPEKRDLDKTIISVIIELTNNTTIIRTKQRSIIPVVGRISINSILFNLSIDIEWTKS